MACCLSELANALKELFCFIILHAAHHNIIALGPDVTQQMRAATGSLANDFSPFRKALNCVGFEEFHDFIVNGFAICNHDYFHKLVSFCGTRDFLMPLSKILYIVGTRTSVTNVATIMPATTVVPSGFHASEP